MKSNDSAPPKMPEYHQSGINQYLKCPTQYMFRHLMGIKTPPKAALIIGRAVDDGQTLNFKQKIESKKDEPLDVVMDAFDKSFEKNSPGTDWGSKPASDSKDLGYKLTEIFHKLAAPTIQP